MTTAPVHTAATVAMPAEAARLNATYDPERLLAELDAVRNRTWEKQRVYSETGVGAATDVDWRCLALRSPGGDGTRTDPGGPGPRDFAPTEWLDRMPYVREVLDSIPAPLHAVRFMALGTDTVGIDHTDPKYGPRWGVARLHVPVTTNPRALLVLDGVTHRWQPGEFWFGDFSRVHHVENTGPEPRVHLVVDALVTPGLVRVFPEAWQEYFASGEVLYNRPSCGQRAEERARLECSFDVPATFPLWEEDGTLDVDQPWTRVSVRDDGTQLVLDQGTGQPYALVHIDANEYRLAGWSEERTLQLFLEGRQPHAVLRIRDGRSVTERSVPAVPGRTDGR
ncbi:aspartyl/asparaginyl beta-hydroxylase domain-containing protein [Streptomyces coeruleoprunus]|uniref:Aspartyl/asparaginyl beta-hydroxylase domain-containing protein n=1 Tax=Streptomyces coeruleoprunus TaxID=285563 RepID=A0ABV9XIS3_9ACTN